MDEGVFDQGRLKFRSMVLPDQFIEHDRPEKLYVEAGLDAKGIVKKVLDTLGQGQSAARSLSA